MAIHSSILAWRIPLTEKPGRLQSIGSVGHNWSDLACRSLSPTPSCKPPSSQKDMRNLWGFPGGSGGKESACNTGDPGSIPRLWRSHGEGNGNPLEYSCLENSKNRGAWRATVHGVTKSWMWLGDWHLMAPSIAHLYVVCAQGLHWEPCC